MGLKEEGEEGWGKVDRGEGKRVKRENALGEHLTYLPLVSASRFA